METNHKLFGPNLSGSGMVAMETAQLSDGTVVLIEPRNKRFPTLERRAFNYSRHVACEHGSWEYCTFAALDDAPSFIRWYSANDGPSDY